MNRTTILGAFLLVCAAVGAQTGKENGIFAPIPAAEEALNTPCTAAETHQIAPMAVSRAYSTVYDLVGSYVWSYYSYMSGSGGYKQSTVNITVANPIEGTVKISGLGANLPVYGTFDPDAATLTIANNQYLGKDAAGDDTYFYLKALDGNGGTLPGATDAAASIGNIAGDVITFDGRDIWVIGDPANELAGFWNCTTLNTFTNTAASWEDFGTATFEDGWVLWGFNMVPSENRWEVDVQKSTIYPDTYRLVSPYSAEGCPKKGTEEGYIQFSLADPEMVYVYPNIYSGFKNGKDPLYLFNLEGFYADKGYTKDQIQSGFTVDAFSSYADGVVTVHNCCFDVRTPAVQRYAWNDKSGASLRNKMIATITVHRLVEQGGTGTLVVPENAPTVYYTVSGMCAGTDRASLAPGIYIARSGASTAKILIRP